MQTIDARGLSCPEPVLLARRAIQDLRKGDELTVLVESATSRENVRRMATSLGCVVKILDQDNMFQLVIQKA